MKEWQRQALLFCFCLGRGLPGSFRRDPANVTSQHVHTCTVWENTLLCVLYLFQAAQLSEPFLRFHIETFVDVPLLCWSMHQVRAPSCPSFVLGLGAYKSPPPPSFHSFTQPGPGRRLLVTPGKWNCFTGYGLLHCVAARLQRSAGPRR